MVVEAQTQREDEIACTFEIIHQKQVVVQSGDKKVVEGR